MRLKRCDKCGRDEPDVLASHRTSTQKHLEGMLVQAGYVKTKAEATIVANALIEKM